MIVVSHDVRSTRRIADHVVVLLPGGESVQGTPVVLQRHPDARVRAFMDDEIAPAVVEAAAHAAEPRAGEPA
jgi:ABC-type transporter Mla maintaining outer membrane lipid asymmetry ATPase subunit MlaF